MEVLLVLSILITVVYFVGSTVALITGEPTEEGYRALALCGNFLIAMWGIGLIMYFTMKV